MENKNVSIKQTEDGSHTLYLPTIDETYHSIHGAINESLHIFLQSGLDLVTASKIRILEVGFGTGLNAYLTAIEANRKKQETNYVSVEKHPLPEQIWSQLNYADIYGRQTNLFEKIHRSTWNKTELISPYFRLQKIQGMIETVSLEQGFNLCYYDAFSPEKQPELWTEEIFRKIYSLITTGGILVTYCAKGAVRRALQSVGFTVERIPGPVGKREILRATKA